MRHAWERPLLLVLITAAKHVEIVYRSRDVPVQALTVVQITSSRVAAPMQVSCHQEIPDPGTEISGFMQSGIFCKSDCTQPPFAGLHLIQNKIVRPHIPVAVLPCQLR